MNRSSLLAAVTLVMMIAVPACSSQNDDSDTTDATTNASDSSETDAKTDSTSPSDASAEHDSAVPPDSTTDGFTDASEDVENDRHEDVLSDVQTDTQTDVKADVPSDVQTDVQNDADAAPPTSVRIMTYNILHGGYSNLKSIADVINAQKPDIVGLQEVDKNARRSGNIDQAKKLSDLTKLPHHSFQGAIKLSGGGDYGVAFLSRFPIVKATKKNLTSKGEQRILAMIDVETSSGTFTVGVTHFGLKDSERVTQATEVIGEIGSRPTSLLLGDLNATPESTEIKSLTAVFRDSWALVGSGPGYTFSSKKPSSRIDYILLGKSWPKPTQAKVVSSTASDHLPLVVDVPLFSKP